MWDKGHVFPIDMKKHQTSEFDKFEITRIEVLAPKSRQLDSAETHVAVAVPILAPVENWRLNQEEHVNELWSHAALIHPSSSSWFIFHLQKRALSG